MIKSNTDLKQNSCQTRFTCERKSWTIARVVESATMGVSGMKIDSPLRELGTVDSGALIAAIAKAGAKDWEANKHRQQTYDAHHSTQSLVMLFSETKDWPHITVNREAGWDILAETAQPLIDQIIAAHYPPGGLVMRAMAARLPPGDVIKPHVDTHPSFSHAHRIHIPVTTNPRVRFSLDGRPHQLQVGQAYEINNQLMHSVINRGKEDRINFIFDYAPPSHMDNFTFSFSEGG